MLLANYYKVMRAMFQRDYQFSTTSYAGRSDNRFCYPTSYNSNYIFLAINDVAGTNLTDGAQLANNGNTVVVVCGSGTTAPTAADHHLENDNTASFTHVSTSCAVGITDGAVTRTFTRTLKNDTAADLTISEVGVVKATGISFDSKMYYVLIQRTVLASPVTVGAGKTATIQISITEGNDTVTATAE